MQEILLTDDQLAMVNGGHGGGYSSGGWGGFGGGSSSPSINVSPQINTQVGVQTGVNTSAIVGNNNHVDQNNYQWAKQGQYTYNY